MDVGADPVALLAEGSSILGPVLRPAGFTFLAGQTGVGSGGRFASGRWTKGSRSIELHFRHSLGLVRYHLGARSISHDDFMWSVTRGRGGNQYPGFSDDPLQGFRDLTQDLMRYGQEFLVGPDGDLDRRIDDATAHPKPSGLKAVTDGGAP